MNSVRSILLLGSNLIDMKERRIRMKKLFISADEELKELGFKKVDEGKWGVEYEKPVISGDEFSYQQPVIHVLTIGYKESGNHLIQSYERRLNSDLLNNTYGLTYAELKAIEHKYKEMCRKYNWKRESRWITLKRKDDING